MSKRVYTWFVEPLDGNTNLTVAQELSEENYCHQTLCQDGQRHNLWGCAGRFVSAMVRSEQQTGLRFKVFNRTGNGQIRECTFLRKQKKRRLFIQRPV